MFEPTKEVQQFMKMGGFESVDHFAEWMRIPLDDWDEPDWAEIAFREMGCFDSGSGDDNDPDVLEYMQSISEAYIQETQDRLTRYRGSLIGGEFIMGKQPNDVVLVHVVLSFSCPASHEMTIPFSTVQAPDAIKKLDLVEFPLECHLCGWKGTLKGNQQIGMKLAE